MNKHKKQKDIRVLQCACNCSDDFHKRVWWHAKNRSNTSSYIFRLIARDMEQGGQMLFYNKEESSQQDNSDYLMQLI